MCRDPRVIEGASEDDRQDAHDFPWLGCFRWHGIGWVKDTMTRAIFQDSHMDQLIGRS
jgi:hypothetical protein